MAKATLRYHVYQAPALGHNERDKDVIAGENAKNKDRWIDPAAHEVWGPGLTEKEAYGVAFGDAIEEYNEKQKRKDRQMTVDDYLASVKADTRGRKNKAIDAANKRAVEQGRPEDVRKAKGKSSSIEITFSLGNAKPLRDASGKLALDALGKRVTPGRVPESVAREIYQEYTSTFQVRNPGMYMYRADYHTGEWFRVKRGGTDITDRGGPSGRWAKGVDHVHMAIIPIGEGYKQGLSRQVSTGKALAALGYKPKKGPDGKEVSPWEQWQERERDYIAGIAAKYGYELQREGSRETSLSVSEYQDMQDTIQDAYDDIADQRAALDVEKAALSMEREQLEKDKEAVKQGHDAVTKRMQTGLAGIREMADRIEGGQEVLNTLNDFVSDMAAFMGRKTNNKTGVSMYTDYCQDRARRNLPPIPDDLEAKWGAAMAEKRRQDEAAKKVAERQKQAANAKEIAAAKEKAQNLPSTNGKQLSSFQYGG